MIHPEDLVGLLGPLAGVDRAEGVDLDRVVLTAGGAAAWKEPELDRGDKAPVFARIEGSALIRF